MPCRARDRKRGPSDERSRSRAQVSRAFGAAASPGSRGRIDRALLAGGRVGGRRRAGENERAGIAESMAARCDSSRLWTIGHGNRSSEDFVQLLQYANIETVIDVRAYPVSRRHPHFSRPPLAAALAGAGIEYLWEGAALGGR